MKTTILTTKAIYEEINNSSMTINQKIKSLLFIEEILTNKQAFQFADWITLSQKQLEYKYGSGYKDWFYKLKELGILITRSNGTTKVESYSKQQQLPKQYKINYIYKDYLFIISYIQKKHPKGRGYIQVNIKDILKEKGNPYISLSRPNFPLTDNQQLTKENMEYITKYNLTKLKFDDVKILDKIELKLQEIKTKIRINENINDRIILVNFVNFSFNNLYQISNKKYYIKEIKEKENLIYINKKYYILKNINIDDFIKYILNELKFNYTGRYYALVNGELFSGINNTNNRLDSNITNLAGFITDEIVEQNNLVQFDLANSQFAIFSHLFPNIDKSYIKASQQGEIYEHIQTHLNIESRTEAKQNKIELFFSDNSRHKNTKDLLGTIFPKAIKTIHDYKEENGKESLPILLQKYESDMFIGSILNKLYSEDIWALSKHDSIICNKYDEKYVKEVIDKEFEKRGFKGKIKIINNK